MAQMIPIGKKLRRSGGGLRIQDVWVALDDFPLTTIAFGLPEVADFIATEHFLDDAGQRFGDDDGYDAGVVLVDPAIERLPDSLLGLFDRFPTWGTDRFRIVLELPIDFRLVLADFVDQLALPEAVIEISKCVDDTHLRLAPFGQHPGRLHRRFARCAVYDIELHSRQVIRQFFCLVRTDWAEWNIE